MLALQATALPSIAVASSELMPAMASLLSQSRRAFASKAHPASSRAFSLNTRLSTSLLSKSSSTTSSIAVRDAFATARKSAFAANSFSSRSPTLALSKRYISKLSAFQPNKPPRAPFTKVLSAQRRSAWTASASHNNLARAEAAATQNPHSAVAQNAFYQALLKANMPQIVVERYQSGYFASNAQCEAAYHQALGALGGANVGQQGFDATLGNSPGFNPQFQAVGQAVAAQARGGNVAISRGENAGSSGARSSPLYVVVEETIGGIIFKWIKLLLYFALSCYICMGLFSLAVETMGSFKKGGAKPGGVEAKAAQQTVRFTDVHGCDEAKEELQEVVDFLKNPEKFTTLGGKLPKGLLLVGPPGTGKTLLARAVAGEAGVPFFYMSGSEFDEVYVGVGAKRVRDLFNGAKAKSPAIIFIDELDAIGAKRSARDNWAKQTLNQLLTELDGFEQNSGVIIIAATNFPELLDKALTRPGRFDKNVVVGLPDVRGRMAILAHHLKQVKPADDVNIELLAAGTSGLSGAELENVVNQAAVHASKAKATSVKMTDFEWAKDKVRWGAEKRSMFITDKEKEMTAYHEAGHALACMYTPGANKLHKITILPRGSALGMTMHLPEMDSYSMSMNQYRAHIDVAMGGKVAEELIYGPGEVTSGCYSDIKTATQVAYQMVTQFGMSDTLGNVDLRSNFNQLSGTTKQLIEHEVQRTIEEGRLRCHNLLVEKREELELLTKALVKYETLDRVEAEKVIRGEELEGRFIMPSGNIKRPEVDGPIKPELPIPPIPGSPEATKGNGPKDPPNGLIQG